MGPASTGGAEGPEDGLSSGPSGVGLRRGLVFFGGTSSATELWENGTTPARLAISFSPNCQCILSAARQGIFISFATWLHISCLNLFPTNTLSAGCFKVAHVAPRKGIPRLNPRWTLADPWVWTGWKFTFHTDEPAGLFSPRPTQIGVPSSSDNEDDTKLQTFQANFLKCLPTSGHALEDWW